MSSIKVSSALVALAATLAAQSPAPKTKDGKPDLSGFWQPDNKFTGDFAKALKPGEKIAMLPAGEKVMKARSPKEDPATTRCLPMGVPRLSPYPEKIVQTPKEIMILEEGDIHTFRSIYMTRKHPEELPPSWYGDSTGKWEGDTLVVDTTSFNDRTWLDAVGHPHGEKLHVIERYRRPSLDRLDLEVTVEDPEFYSKPFTMSGSFKLVTDREIHERYCYKSPADK